MTKALIYCRVSSTRQKTQGSGLDSQEHLCRTYAADKGYEVEHVFPDDITGSDDDFMQRPGMVALLQYLKKHKKTDYVVIFDDLKRFARNTLAHLNMRLKLKEYGATVECPNYKFDDSPEGMFIETMFAAQGQLEAGQGARQTHQKMKARLEKGYWVFFKPVGYKYADGQGGGRVLVKDEPLASIVTEALEGFASGRFQTKAEVKYFLESQPEYPKGRDGKVHHQHVERVLTQLLYSGHLESEALGVSLRKAQHEPIITLETFHKIQERLKGNAYAPTRKDINEDFPLRGAVVCGDCNHPLTACWSKGKLRKYPYYLCHHKGCPSYRKSIPRDQLESEFETVLAKLQPTQGLFNAAEKMFRTLWAHKEQHQKSRSKALKTQLTQTQGKIDKLLDNILDAELSSVIKAYERKIKNLETDKLLIKEKMENCVTPNQPFDAMFEHAMTFLSNPLDIWASGHFDLKRLVLKLAFPAPLIYDRNTGVRTPEIALPFKYLTNFNTQKMKMAEREGFEPPVGLTPRLISSQVH